MLVSDVELERRCFPRYSVLVAGRYWIDDEGCAAPCDLKDVSLGGARIELPSYGWLEPGSFATVELPVPGGVTLIVTPVRVLAVTGRVRRVAHLRFLDESRNFRRIVRDAAENWKLDVLSN